MSVETATSTRRIPSIVLWLAAVVPAVAYGEINLYESGETKLNLTTTVLGAGFLQSDPWFGESESFLGDDTDDWFEFGGEAGLDFTMPLGGGTLFGAISGVYTNTSSDDASGLTIGESDTSDFTAEQGHIGFRFTEVFDGLEEDEISITGGSQDYSIGTGMLINDGAGDGGERGGWYLGMRKAFSDAVIARLKSKELLVEGFYVENDPRRGGTDGEATGANVEYYFEEIVTVGVTYMVVEANIPNLDELDVYDGRLEVKATERLSFAGEFAHEESDQIEADGWYAQATYELTDTAWTPSLTYRYAHFDGDDPDTVEDERFREVAYGFTDYGYWFQGEIAGNYPLGNGNIESHMLRAKAQPQEGVTLNLFFYSFTLDHPAALDPAVTDDDYGNEVDFIVDWAVTEHASLTGVVGALFPGDAAEQWVGGDDDWLYAMLLISYSL